MTQYTSERLHIATYSNGPQGRGISKIDNYYFASTSNNIEDIPETSDNRWKDSINNLGSKFNETNKYLWNFERITYTDNTSSDTNRTMLAVYSKDGKGIVGIYEYYKCTETSAPPSTLPTVSDKNGWIQEGEKDGGGNTISLPIPTAEAPYLWNYEIIDYTEGDDVTSGPVCIGTFGTPGDSLQVQYQYAETISGLVAGNWSNTEPARPTADGKWLLWMRQKMSNVSTWSTPIQISALNGEPGADGSDIDYIYFRSQTEVMDWTGKGPSSGGGWNYTTSLQNNWESSPQGITPVYKYEYMTFSNKPAGKDQEFGPFQNPPILWSKWGDKGQDGAGIEYKYCRATSQPEAYPGTGITWTDEPQGVNSTNRYEYVCQLKTTYNTTTGEWDPEETSTNISLWNEYKENGKYVYATFEPNEIRKGTTNSITINLMQRIGEGAPVNCTDTAYLYYTRDSGTETLAGKFSNGQYTFDITGSINDKIQFSIYNSNSNDKKIIDKKTILALADGETAYYLYHNAASDGSVPDAPNANYTYDGIESENEQNWYDTQQPYSMYQTYKVCSSSKYDETGWGPVRRISGELTTYKDLWNVLEKESDEGQADGIYSFTDGEGKNRIGINADLIKVGAIRGKQLLNGNEVTNFFLTSDGQGESVPEFFASANENPYGDNTTLNGVAFKAGSQFAVTVDGTVFAKAGKIGDLTIGNIASRDYADNVASTAVSNLEVGGRNLFVSANAQWYASTATKLSSGNGWNVSAPSGNGGLKILENITAPDQQYVLSYKLKKTGGTLASIGGHCDAYDTNKFELDGITQKGNPQSGFTMKDDALTHTVKWYFTRTNNDVIDKNLYIQVNRKSGGGSVTFDLWDIKLEKGNKATDWTPAPEDVQADIGAIQTQVDGKAEIYYQSGDPKPKDDSWDNNESIGNMWRNTTDNKEYIWRYDSVRQQYGWHEMEIPNNVFNAYDGKATLFVEKPEKSYKKKDLWILDKQGVDNTTEDYDVTYPPYKKGTLVVASNDSTSYAKNDWVEKIRYTDDTVANEAKTKAEAAYTEYTTLAGDISNGIGVFSDGLKQQVTKNTLNDFGLQAGSLIVYDKDSYDEETNEYKIIFSAQSMKDDSGKPTNGAISLAGWSVTSKQLTTGTIGKENSFGIYPQGVDKDTFSSSEFVWKNKLADADAWIMTAGENFGLTKNGVLYAKTGVIGDMQIGDIASKQDIDTLRPNLYADTARYDNKAIWKQLDDWVITEEKDSLGNKYLFRQGAWAGVYQLVYLEAGVTYTLSANVKGNGADAIFYINEGGAGSANALKTEDSITAEKRISCSYTPATSGEYSFRIESSIGSLYIASLKLEKGSEPSSWCLDTVSTFSSNLSSNNFSWKFSPTEGVFMYNGVQLAENEVFKIYRIEVGDSYTAWIKGHIEASGGVIGALGINTNGISGDGWTLSRSGLVIGKGGKIDIDGTIFTTSGNKEATITSAGNVTIKSKDGYGFTVGPSTASNTITATTVQYKYGNKALNGWGDMYVDIVFNKPPAENFTLYWFCYSDKHDDQSGSKTFTVNGTTTKFNTGLIELRDRGGNDYVGFSIQSAGQAEQQARDKGIGIALGNGSYSTIEIYGNTLTEYSSSSDAITVNGSLIPTNDSRTLGMQAAQWGDVWCRDGAFNGSDRHLKKDISFCCEKYEELFDKLRPVKFKWKVNTSDRYHTGFIAQEVEEAILTSGLTTQDLAAFAKFKKDDGDYGYSLRYTEFISLNTWQIQKLKPRVSTLEQTIIDYETRISNLEAEIQNLKSQ